MNHLEFKRLSQPIEHPPSIFWQLLRLFDIFYIKGFGERFFFVGKGKGKKVFGEGIFVEEKKKRDGKDRISLEKGGGGKLYWTWSAKWTFFC